MAEEVTRSSASVGASMRGSSTCSTAPAPTPRTTTAFISRSPSRIGAHTRSPWASARRRVGRVLAAPGSETIVDELLCALWLEPLQACAEVLLTDQLAIQLG